jgi:hypothetical protein
MLVRGPMPIPSVVTGPFPGQPGNLVGFAATPASPPSPWTVGTWPGAFPGLTAYPVSGNQSLSTGVHAQTGSGTAGDPYVFSFYDFNAAGGGVAISLSNCIFVGCRFQSNDVANYNVATTGANINFFYCSFVPLASLYTAPPGLIWPSAGALQNTITQVTDTNCIAGNSGFQYGLTVNSGGPVLADHCDCWGAGNDFCQMLTVSAGVTCSDCWSHDAPNASPQGYHIDGIGYVNGAAAPSNITVKHCTVAGIGNTNGIAFQAATTPYSHISVTGCYFSGFGFLVDMCHNTTGNNNLTFTDNVFGTDLQSIFGPLFANYATQFTGSTNLWRRNKFKVIPGTTPNSGAFSFTSSDDGKFLLPNQTLNVTDWAL